MIRRRSRAFAILSGIALAMVCAEAAAFAQTYEGLDPRASFSAGASLIGGGRTFFIGSDGFNTQFQNGVRIAFRATFDIREHWGVEGTYGFASNTLQVTRTTPVQNVVGFGTHIHQFEANGHYFFTDQSHRIRPFATAGLGIFRYVPTSGAKTQATTQFLDQPAVMSADTHPEFIVGVGAEAGITGHLGVRVDIRDHITGITRFGLPENAISPGGAQYPISGHINNWEISGGVEYHFH